MHIILGSTSVNGECVFSVIFFLSFNIFFFFCLFWSRYFFSLSLNLSLCIFFFSLERAGFVHCCCWFSIWLSALFVFFHSIIKSLLQSSPIVHFLCLCHANSTSPWSSSPFLSLRVFFFLFLIRLTDRRIKSMCCANDKVFRMRRIHLPVWPFRLFFSFVHSSFSFFITFVCDTSSFDWLHVSVSRDHKCKRSYWIPFFLFVREG